MIRQDWQAAGAKRRSEGDITDAAIGDHCGVSN
jgi:hypothetical protein